MQRTVTDATVWEHKLQELIERTEKSGVAIRYKLDGVTLVANGCQVWVGERTIWSIPKPTIPLGLGESALGVALPDPDHPLVGWFLFEDHQGGIYLAVEMPLCAHLPRPKAELELATSQELLDSEVHAPLIH